MCTIPGPPAESMELSYQMFSPNASTTKRAGTSVRSVSYTHLKNAGLWVAMGNSAPYIQEMAKEVTLDNNSGGVAHIVEKYILK